MDSLNRSLFLALNASAGAGGPVVWFAIFAAKYLILLVPLHLVLLWVAGDRRMRMVALTGLAALVIAVVINQAVGLVSYSPRPFVIGLGNTLIEHRPSSSMPSNHATIFFTYALVLALYRRRGLALVTLVLGLVTAWSRIYLGIHYPLDMAAAAVTAIVSAFAARALATRFGEAALRPAEALWARILGLVGLGSRPVSPPRR